MRNEDLRFKSKERKSREEAAVFLRQLADKIEAGKLTLKQGSEEVLLELPGDVTVEIEVEDKKKQKKGIQHKLEVEIKWYEGDDASGPVELG
ncbi:amphi-Trp domain-containing protein [Balneolales bacterium ANBcel1]|nr:amphi-Trp domain-containing protein [Balneolales bacterium ANBcel1]